MQQNSKQSEKPRQESCPQWAILAILLLSVCACVVSVHWPALSAQALSFDDGQYLTDNLLVQNPSWRSARRFLTEVLEPSTVPGYYQPLNMISLMLDYALGGRPDNLLPFHRTSLALHVANTALVIVLLYLLFGQAWAAAGVGLLFGLHPMTVEPIPWVGERKTLLAAFFALWCLIIYVRFARKSSWKLYVGCMVMYVLALMSKPTSLPLPAAMLLMDYWPLGRLKRRALLEKVPFFAVAGLFAIITYISQSTTSGVRLPTEYGSEHIPLILCHNIIFYLYKIVWPANLSSYYAFPEPLGLSNPTVLAGVIGSCILIPLLVASLRWTRAVLAGWLFFLVTILPTMQIIGFSNVIASNKFAYLPSVGLLMVLVLLLRWFCSNGKLTTRRVTVVIIVLILAGAEAVATRRHLVYWRNKVDLFEYMLSLAPNAAPLHHMLGDALVEKDRDEEALKHYEEALRIEPHYFYARNNMGEVFIKMGKVDEAIACCIDVLRFRKDLPVVYYNLGVAYEMKEEYELAVQSLNKALQLKPDYPDALNNLAVILKRQGKNDESVEKWEKVLQLKPNHSKAHFGLGLIMAERGKYDEAIKHFNETLREKPDWPRVHYHLGEVYYRQGRIEEAISHWRQAVQLKPDFAEAHKKLTNAIHLQDKSN